MSRARLHHPEHFFPAADASGCAAMNLEFQSRTIPRRAKYTAIWFPDEIKDLACRSPACPHERTAGA